MFNGYKVVVVIPSGRRQTMEILLSYVLSSQYVDECHLWVNTNAEGDLSYMNNISQQFDKVKLVFPYEKKRSGNEWAGPTICQFFKNCVENNTIYVRLDDDVVYLEGDFFRKLLEYRLRNPDHFLVYPQIINNAVSTYLMNKRGAFLSTALDVTANNVGFNCMDDVGWKDGDFAAELHKFFISRLSSEHGASQPKSQWSLWLTISRLIRNRLDRAELQKHLDPLESIRVHPQHVDGRFSINCIAWFGERFSRFSGVVPEDEELWLSEIAPRKFETTNSICGDAICAHWAFTPQRPHLESTELLQKYLTIAHYNHPNFYKLNSDVSYARGVGLQDVDFVSSRLRNRYKMFFDKYSNFAADITLNEDGRITENTLNAVNFDGGNWDFSPASAELFLTTKKRDRKVSMRCMSLGRLDNQDIEFAGDLYGEVKGSQLCILRNMPF